MSNFGFLPSTFREIAEPAVLAESHILGDPRAACFHARFALEALVHWLYRHDTGLQMPYDESLGALLHEPSFQNALPPAVFQKARVIQKQGNQAVHSGRPVRQYDALQVVKELHHVCYWITRVYAPDAATKAGDWRDDLVPKPVDGSKVVPREDLLRLEQKLAEQSAAALKHQQERDALDGQLQQVRAELAQLKAAAATKPDPHNYDEAETRSYLIDVDLHRAGWALDSPRDQEYEVRGMPNNEGVGYVDYVLWGDDGKPLGLVEAKKTTVNPAAGQQQAKLYADCLEQMHGQRPIIFYTNGYKTYLWDDSAYPPREVAGFYKKDELASLVMRRTRKQKLDTRNVKTTIVERYYQKRAIGSIAEQFEQARRKALLVMATGTGKTRTAIALVDLLQRASWVKRALFLADRVSLVRQAANAFKAHLPDSSPVNLVTDKDTEGRVYVSTYPTMMGLIDETKKGVARFGVGHFDLVIIDEAHRSVYQKYGEIFRYFDASLVGLTATPREQVDRNTYELFELEPGVPTDAYELETAVRDGFLVPPKVQKVNLRFPGEGIDYDSLTKEEQDLWENTDWGDEGSPRQVNAGAINNWLFNKDTVDKVLQHLMEHGHKVEGGDRLAKTIIFARNHDHAMFIEERFNHHYPHLKGSFARVIDNYAKYAQSLIDDFSVKDKEPHIAISVDMLDTGIDVPEVANLVFFKPVYSKIKFWQMIGRGTRLCPDLFGPGTDKADFRVFDFCFNFDFFKENPDGIEGSGGAPLGTRLFRSRVQLLGHLQAVQTLDTDGALKKTLTDLLHGEVAAMNRENFIVRMHLEPVERFQRQEAWAKLSEADRNVLHHEVAGLPSKLATDDIESRLFDFLALRMQLAKVEGNDHDFETNRLRVVEIAAMLEEKSAVPAVKAQLDYLARLQEIEFWQHVGLAELEDMRLRLRGLAPLIDKQKRKIVFTAFEDVVHGISDEPFIDLPKMTGVQYEKKVRDYLKNHLDDETIQKLRRNEPLSTADLEHLESTLVKIGDDEGETLLDGLLKQRKASLPYFVRSLVGMDRATAQAAFAEYLSDRRLTTQQIRFIEMVIDQLASRGVIDNGALYDDPFLGLHSGGPDELFAGHEAIIEGIFEKLRRVTSNVLGMAG
ncbi:MAG: DEAD/DEAH box helicase family protein [Planctomycetota bacterium]|nr:DEAD/DEAH box helicase family protein [Planctomycetota bacterium]